MTKPPLVNPYTEIPREAKTRLNADVSHHDWNLIKSVCPMHGIASTICSLTIHHLANECRTRNWTIADVNQFIALVRNNLSNISRRAASVTDGERPLLNDGRGVTEVCPPPAVDKAVDTNSDRAETTTKTKVKRGAKGSVKG